MIPKTSSLALAVAVFTFVQSSQAQTNLLPVTFNAVCTSSSSNGIVQERVSNINLIDDCAAEHGLTNLDHLRLVFNPTNFSVQVVDTNGVALCTSLSFTGGLTFTNMNTNSVSTTVSNSTQIVFQRDVTVDTNSSTSGVISGSASWNNSDLSSFRLTATLLYTEPAGGTNKAEICRALLSVRAAEQEENEGDEDHGGGRPGSPGNQGNNGNHFGWQNPKNPHSRR
ncbi:MAG TPA: hypothetical protein VL793_00985 [Patescibacteria group bacterium]|nr:hypothetical protein [Patescibacteria group bacterium]